MYGKCGLMQPPGAFPVMMKVTSLPEILKTLDATAVVMLSVLAKHLVLDYEAGSFASTLSMTGCRQNNALENLITSETNPRRLDRRSIINRSNA
jgi:hypothetical protein